MKNPPHTPPERSADELREWGHDLAIESLLTTLYENEPKTQKKSRCWKPLGAIAAGVLILLGFGLMRQLLPAVSAPNVLTILDREGSIEIQDSKAKHTVSSPHALQPGQRIITGKNASVRLAFADKTELHLHANSILENQSGTVAGSTKKLYLEQGGLSAQVAPQKDNMQITTPHAVAAVLGTRFSLEVLNNAAELVVEEGRVAFAGRTAKQDYIITQGQLAEMGEDVAYIELNQDTAPVLNSFTLVNAGTGQPMAGYDPVPEGAIIPLESLPPEGINMRVNAHGRIEHIIIRTNERYAREYYPPYSLAGDDIHFGGGYKRWDVLAGEYEILAYPVDRQGHRGDTKTMHIEFR